MTLSTVEQDALTAFFKTKRGNKTLRPTLGGRGAPAGCGTRTREPGGARFTPRGRFVLCAARRGVWYCTVRTVTGRVRECPPPTHVLRSLRDTTGYLCLEFVWCCMYCTYVTARGVWNSVPRELVAVAAATGRCMRCSRVHAGVAAREKPPMLCFLILSSPSLALRASSMLLRPLPFPLSSC